MHNLKGNAAGPQVKSAQRGITDSAQSKVCSYRMPEYGKYRLGCQAGARSSACGRPVFEETAGISEKGIFLCGIAFKGTY